MTRLNLTEKQLKVLTWLDDVEGMAAYDCGDVVYFHFELMPDFWTKEISKEDFTATLEDIEKVKAEQN